MSRFREISRQSTTYLWLIDSLRGETVALAIGMVSSLLTASYSIIRPIEIVYEYSLCVERFPRYDKSAVFEEMKPRRTWVMGRVKKRHYTESRKSDVSLRLGRRKKACVVWPPRPWSCVWNTHGSLIGATLQFWRQKPRVSRLQLSRSALRARPTISANANPAFILRPI